MKVNEVKKCGVGVKSIGSKVSPNHTLCFFVMKNFRIDKPYHCKPTKNDKTQKVK